MGSIIIKVIYCIDRVWKHILFWSCTCIKTLMKRMSADSMGGKYLASGKPAGAALLTQFCRSADDKRILMETFSSRLGALLLFVQHSEVWCQWCSAVSLMVNFLQAGESHRYTSNLKWQRVCLMKTFRYVKEHWWACSMWDVVFILSFPVIRWIFTGRSERCWLRLWGMTEVQHISLCLRRISYVLCSTGAS